MTTLADIDIELAVASGDLAIDPWEPIVKEGRLQPASVDLTLGDEFLVPKINTPPTCTYARAPLSFREDGLKPEYNTIEVVNCRLRPGQFVLGTTVERVKIGKNIRGSIEGKSTIGRWGICIHITAGFFDPGFEGHATLEIVNHSPNTIELVPGMKICQMAFHYMHRAPRRPYGSKGLGSHYQGQVGVTGPR